MTSKVSIILTTHGTAPYLKQAIGSVLAQTHENWELIIACDGPLQVEPQPYGWGMSDHRMRQPVFDVPEGVQCRYAYTINQAFKQCNGDYITYLCHDDLYLPWRLELMVQRLGCCTNSFSSPPSVVFGYQQLMTEGDNNGIVYTAMCAEGDWNNKIRKGSESQPAGTVDHSSVMHRRECFEKAGGWDENAPMRYGDMYFWQRLQAAGYKFHCIPEVLDAHRFNPHSVSWKLDHPESATL